MNSSHLRNAFILLLLSAFLAFGSFFWLNQEQKSGLAGHLVFANAINYDKAIDKINIHTTKGDFTLELKDNYWRIAQADGYYAGLMLVNDLLSALNKSLYYSKQPATPELLQKYKLEIEPNEEKITNVARLEIYSGDKLLNTITLGARSENGLYTYAYEPGSNDIWLISGAFRLPQYQFSWYQQPLFSYSEGSIKTVASLREDGSKSVLMRLNNKQDFLNQNMQKPNISLFTDELKYVVFQDVKPLEGFDLSKFNQTRKLRLTTFSGLVNELMIYTDGNKYWITTKMSATNLSTAKFSDYIESSKLLTEGWIFELPELSGSILFMTEF